MMTDRFRASIEDETRGQMSQLRIVANGRHLVVHGRAESYYPVQLLIRLSRTFLDGNDGSDSIRLNLNIQGRPLDLNLPAPN